MSKVSINIRVEQTMKTRFIEIGKQLGLSEANISRLAFAEYIERRIHMINDEKSN